MQASQRRRLGAYATPPSLVAAVVSAAIAPERVRGRTVRLLDPACGDGRFLAAAAERIAACGGRPAICGVDIDPQAIASAHATLGRIARGVRGGSSPGLRVGDALTLDWGAERFDVIVGNPPFLNQLATATTRGGRSRFGGGPYADAAAEFLALSIGLATDDGVVGMVLPLSLISTRDTAAIRAAVDAAAALEWMWWSPSTVFDAQVLTWAGVWRRGRAPGAVERRFGPSFAVLSPIDMPTRWAALLHGEDAADHDGPTLGDIATFSVDFREQYYGLVGAVGDDVDGPPLVTSGLIEPGRCLWGARPVRFAKQRYAAPRVALDRLSPRLRRWADSRLVPKVLIANQTRTIEAVHDPLGDWLPSVPVISALTDEPQRLLTVLAGDEAHRWVHARAAGSGLSAAAVRLSPSLLASIPLPPTNGPTAATAIGGRSPRHASTST